MQNDLEELERVLAAGTPGPWQAYEHIVYTGRSGGFSLRDCPKPYDDAALIVAAVNALPSLIEEVKRLREENARQIQWTVGEPPCEPRIIYGHSWGPYRWHPYSPKSEQYRAGVKGRWQRMNEFAGWENAFPPNEWATEKTVKARASLSPMKEQS